MKRDDRRISPESRGGRWPRALRESAGHNQSAEWLGCDRDCADYEARRRLSCGNCFECDNCCGVHPDNAVIELGPGKGFRFDYDYCKGCGICAAECPCGAIEMVAETI